MTQHQDFRFLTRCECVYHTGCMMPKLGHVGLQLLFCWVGSQLHGVVGLAVLDFLTAETALTDPIRRSILKAATMVTVMPPTDPLVGGLGGKLAVQSEVIGSFEPEPFLSSQLARSRLLSDQLSPFQQKLTNFNNELYYPPFLFGAWATTATLKRKIYPFGRDFLPSQSLYEGSPRNREESIGNTAQYDTRYFSTIANTMQNKMTVNLGTGVPSTRIIQDRASNIVSISKAYNQLTPVEFVTWDYSKEPERLTLEFSAGMVADDMRPLGQRQTKLYIPARESEVVSDSVFASAERTRSVTVGPGTVVVSDTETVTEFHLVNENEIQAITRIAVFLTPNPNSREGVLWQQVSGRAVALFDYEVRMQRSVGPDGLACVTTPKEVAQCVPAQQTS